MNRLATTLRRRVHRAVAGSASVDPPPAARTAAAALARAVRRLAFWLGVSLPCLHVPLLLAAGLTETTTPPLVTLWTLQVVALAVGSRYDPGV